MIFDVDVSRTERRATVRVHGDIDLGTGHRLRSTLLELDTVGVNDLVIDLAGVDLLDSTGVGVMVGGLRRARLAGGDLRLANLSERHRELFAVTGLDRVFAVVLTTGCGEPT